MKKIKKVVALLLAVSLVAMSGILAYANVDADSVQPETTSAGETAEDPVEEPVQEPQNAARITGDKEYATLDEAVAAAADGATIELLKDCTTKGLNLSKNLTIKAAENVNNPTVTFTQYGIALWGKSLTFEDCTVVMNGIGSTPYTAEWNWMAICANKDASLTLNNVTMTMEGTDAGNAHAIYFCSNNKLNLTDSTLEIRNYKQDALEWDGGDGGYNANFINSTFVSDHNRSGFTGTFYATIDHSTVNVINSTGNGSNGSNFDIKKESVVNFKNNGSHGLSAAKLTIDNSTVNAIGNGGNGIHATDKMEIKNHSIVSVCENGCTISSQWTIPGAVYVGGKDSSIDDTCTVKITDNKGSGIYVKENATLDMKVGAVMRNTAEKLELGGGINNHGTVALGEAVELYNNHAAAAGDDIFNANDASISFSKVGSGWVLDGEPNHCSDAITGWFDDVEGNRWKAHGTRPYHVDELNEFTEAGTAVVTGMAALKAAHGLLPVDESSDDWQTSKSKEATNLDSNYVSNVTLSLPSAQEALSTDVVFILDKSTSAEVEEQIIEMLDSLKEQVKKTDATVNVGVVIFNKAANRVCELTPLTDENMPAIEAAIKTEIKSGTNLHAGLLAGKTMLDADTATAASHKYLITVSDGITYMFGEEPTAVSWSWVGDSVLSWAGPDNWKAKYETDDAPAQGWSSWLADLAEKVQVTEYDYPYGGTATQSTPAAEKMNYANSIDKALYLSNEVYQAAEAEGYHCYATTATQKTGSQYLWGPSFINYLADGKDVSFEQIQKDIYYLLDAGSYVIDKIGKTADYDFDFYNPEGMILKAGDKEYKAQKSADDSNVYYFGEAENGVYPYVVRYYPENDTNPEEYFKWEINVPVSNLERVCLTYSVKLRNPKTEAGTYGEYDKYGENGKASLYTNNEAILYPVDSDGQPGIPEYFNKPTVSYTVGGATPDNPSTPDYPSTMSVTVQKVWTLDDDGSAAESVTVQLLRDGQPYGDAVILNAANQWKYTWYGQAYGHTYTVTELNVPEGFISTVTKNAYNSFTIVNDDVKADDPVIKPDDNDDNTDTPDTSDKPDIPNKPSTSGDVNKPVNPDKTSDEVQTDVPKTDDEQNLMFWFGLMAVTLAGAGTTLKLARKQK